MAHSKSPETAAGLHRQIQLLRERKAALDELIQSLERYRAQRTVVRKAAGSARLPASMLARLAGAA